MKEKHISKILEKKVSALLIQSKKIKSETDLIVKKYEDLLEHSTEQQTHIQHQYALIESLHETLKEINASLKILCTTNSKG